MIINENYARLMTGPPEEGFFTDKDWEASSHTVPSGVEVSAPRRPVIY